MKVIEDRPYPYRKCLSVPPEETLGEAVQLFVCSSQNPAVVHSFSSREFRKLLGLVTVMQQESTCCHYRLKKHQFTFCIQKMLSQA